MNFDVISMIDFHVLMRFLECNVYIFPNKIGQWYIAHYGYIVVVELFTSIESHQFYTESHTLVNICTQQTAAGFIYWDGVLYTG